MAISAQRFNFLDKETNISIKDFTQLNDNAVYNNVDQLVDTALIDTQNNDALLNTLQTNMNDLSGMLENNDITSTLSDALNSAMDSISNMDLPDVVSDIFDSLKKLDFQGVKDFFKELLHIGSSFLCNNLDFLKLFMLGYALNKNILSGLLIALLLSWLDRYCKGFTQEEMRKSGNRSKMDMMFPPRGVNVNSNNAFNLYSNYYSDYLKANDPLQLATPMDSNSFLTNILSGDITGSISNLRNSEISYSDRNSYLNVLDSNLSSYPVNSPEYRNILSARGQLNNTPLISVNRRSNNIRYENLSDKFGSYIKNLGNTDSISNTNFLNLSTVEKTLYDKMLSLKNTSASSPALQCTPNDSFSDYNFSSILPQLSTEEETHLRNRNVESDSHRLYDLHPTSTIFLQET